MKLSLYEELCTRLLSNTPDELADEYSSVCSLENINGIYMRQVQSIGRKRLWKFDAMKIPHVQLLEKFQRLWEEEGRDDIIVRMTKELHQIPPCTLARTLVKAFIEKNHSCLTWITCDLDKLDLELDNKAAKPNTLQRPSYAKWYREPSLITHEGLRVNVQTCHRVDEHYSPAMDEYRNKIGREYEEKLNGYLNKLGIAYLDEPGMRRMGFSRTPDAVLLEPIAIDGMVVKWIESKAWFGDPPSHATYLRDQYWPYYNRFGPGLVIYWFGFVEEAVEGHVSKGVAVLDSFPDDSRITRIESPMIATALACKPETVR